MVAADARTAITFGLTPGNAHDAPAGHALNTWGQWSGRFIC
ncbi:transposase [Xanthomonas oryzae pv. oryzae PXO99A]|uniref:Transposase n=1 Tax=Xanthomonas oryzae pv. oryzae (strain PXO99A) TaxID=360094 RepID=A0A0K0GKK4_XANOP|nr:transposase [Xanthomonas oryzae pv. oryzae PXO99A]